MNILEDFLKLVMPKKNKPSPADFRRSIRAPKGKYTYLPRLLSNTHIGKFKGGIPPMKRRMRGVSRTAHKTKGQS